MRHVRTWLSGPAWIVVTLMIGCSTCTDIRSIAVVIEVTDEAGAPIDDVDVECAFEDEPFEASGSWCPGPPGHYTVRVTRGDQVVEREVDVALAGRSECNIADTQYLTIVLPDEIVP